MGCLTSKQERVAIERSQQIEHALNRQAFLGTKNVKILLLGAGESGKSTFLKQMRILYQKGFSREDCELYTSVVHHNAVQSLMDILKAMPKMGIDFEEPARKDDMKAFNILVNSCEEVAINRDMSELMMRLWKDPCLQKCFKQARHYQLHDSTAYFLDALERISAVGYVPLEQDILRTRVKSTGINEVNFTYRALSFKVYDIGGQRSERRKWIHCFEAVTCIIFMVAMSEYDLTLAEDNQTNRIHESMRLFDSICNNYWFRNTHMLLFFNKKDLFLSKLSTSPFSIAFPEYPESKQVYTHVTCATDTESVNVSDIIVSENLKDCGLL